MNQQNSNSSISFGRNDIRYPIDHSKNTLNRAHYLRSNLLPVMPHQGFTNYGFYSK